VLKARRHVFVDLGHPVQQFRIPYGGIYHHTGVRVELRRALGPGEGNALDLPKGVEDKSGTVVVREAGENHPTYVG